MAARRACRMAHPCRSRDDSGLWPVRLAAATPLGHYHCGRGLSLSSRIRFDEWSSMPTPPSSVTLVAQHISLARGTRQVLVDVSVTVAPPARLGVIGPNGVGKSTLLA